MKVYIEVTTWFKRFTGGNASLELEISEGTPVVEAVSSAGIPKEEIGFITVIKDNENKIVDDQYILTDGDRLKVYPAIIGG
ncbi:MAG: hypothetical protein N3B21_17220 [Clostridia bacterium]|nr:hypothetical protein [Clostridia bacterium]